jgi:hypothetical protein
LVLNGAIINTNHPELVFNPSDYYSYTAETADAALMAHVADFAGWQPLQWQLVGNALVLPPVTTPSGSSAVASSSSSSSSTNHTQVTRPATIKNEAVATDTEVTETIALESTESYPANTVTASDNSTSSEESEESSSLGETVKTVLIVGLPAVGGLSLLGWAIRLATRPKFVRF